MTNWLWSFFHDNLPCPVTSGLLQCALVMTWQKSAGAHLGCQRSWKRYCCSRKKTGVQSCMQTLFLVQGIVNRENSINPVQKCCIWSQHRSWSLVLSKESSFMLIWGKKNLTPFRSSRLRGNINPLADVLSRNILFAKGRESVPTAVSGCCGYI